MILAVVVLLIVCILGLMMLERNGAFLSKIHLTDTVFSSEASDWELCVVCFASVWSTANLWNSLRKRKRYSLDWKCIITIHMLSNVRIGEVAVGSQESGVSYTIISPRTLLNTAVCFVLLAGTCCCRDEGSFERWDLLVRRRSSIWNVLKKKESFQQQHRHNCII